ncbi:MAG: hypothetical protein ACYDDQ_07470 [Vulcanimicrobiaceae bacterium]
MEQQPSTLDSPFVSAYLAADRIAKQASVFAVHAPVKDVKVNYMDLAAKMFAAGFLRFRDDKALSMEVVEKRVLLVRSRHVVLRKLAGTAQYDPAVKKLYDCFKDGQTARDAVRAWLEVDCENPWAVLFNVVQAQCIEAGLLAEGKKQGMLAAMTSASGRVVPVPDKAQEIATLVDTFVQRWNAFTANEAALEAALIDDCAHGAKSRFVSASATAEAAGMDF